MYSAAFWASWRSSASRSFSATTARPSTGGSLAWGSGCRFYLRPSCFTSAGLNPGWTALPAPSSGWWIFLRRAQSSFLLACLLIGRRSVSFLLSASCQRSSFFSALTSALYYLGVLQKVVYGIAWLLSRTMRLSGTESLSTAANIFVGQTEAPLIVKPYLERMTKSEVLCVMIGRHGQHRGRRARGLRWTAGRRLGGIKEVFRTAHVDPVDHLRSGCDRRLEADLPTDRRDRPKPKRLQGTNRHQPHRCDMRRHDRWPQAGTQRRRHAHSLHRPHRAL